jgi:D-alanyl-D-alanine carboxypeptidase
MGKRIVSILAVGVAVSMAAVTMSPVAAWSETRTQTAALDQLARKLVDAGAPGVIVRVDDGSGRPIEIAEQAAWASRDHVLKPTDEFREGSNTKTMMATLVLQLVAEGKIALTDPVQKWLPREVPNANAITVRMLLNHTSGLYDYATDPALLPSILGKDHRTWTSAKLLAVGASHPVEFPPGAKFSYSNTNYAAIGTILERVTGQSLADLVRDRIARPLGLRHTYFATDPRWRGAHVHGYEFDAEHLPPEIPAVFGGIAGVRHDGHVDVSDIDPDWGGPAGAMVSTGVDWARFYTALMSGKLLPAAELAAMRTTVPIIADQPAGPRYGLGISTSKTPCGTFWGHDGGMPGYLSTNATDVTGTRTMTVLVSTEIWSEFGAEPAIEAAAEALQVGAVCAMFGERVPG